MILYEDRKKTINHVTNSRKPLGIISRPDWQEFGEEVSGDPPAIVQHRCVPVETWIPDTLIRGPVTWPAPSGKPRPDWCHAFDRLERCFPSITALKGRSDHLTHSSRVPSQCFMDAPSTQKHRVTSKYPLWKRAFRLSQICSASWNKSLTENRTNLCF